jgi:hypothetical protein
MWTSTTPRRCARSRKAGFRRVEIIDPDTGRPHALRDGSLRVVDAGPLLGGAPAARL